MDYSVRSVAWLFMAFVMSLISVVVLSYQTSFTGPGYTPAPAAEPVAQKASPAALTAAQQVQSATERFRRAMIEAKPEWIITLSEPKLTFGHSNGVVQTREQFADAVRSGEEIFKRIDFSNKRLTVVGDTAVERYHFSADIVYQGKLMNFELEVVEVWRKTDKWRLLTRQAIKT